MQLLGERENFPPVLERSVAGGGRNGRRSAGRDPSTGMNFTGWLQTGCPVGLLGRFNEKVGKPKNSGLCLPEENYCLRRHQMGGNWVCCFVKCNSKCPRCFVSLRHEDVDTLPSWSHRFRPVNMAWKTYLSTFTFK